MARVRYSDAFKRQIVEEIETGRHGSLNGVAQAYGIGGMSTVARWVSSIWSGGFTPQNCKGRDFERTRQA